MSLIGHQERVEWMGESVVTTLADLWPDPPRAMIVGLNPAPVSVSAGHYYQGSVGQRQLQRLTRAGFFDAPTDGTFFEQAALRAGVGFTDIVKRPSSGESQVSNAEISYGKSVITRTLADRGIELVVCVFRHPVKALLGSTGRPGFQHERTGWGARVFRMPGPYDRKALVAEVMSTLWADL